MPSRVRQIVFPLLAAFIWGTAFVSQSMSKEYLGAFAYNATRSVVACLFLLIVIAFFRKIRPADFPKKTTKDKKLLLISGVSCGVLLALATNLQQFGIFGTSVGKAGFITALYVVLVPDFNLHMDLQQAFNLQLMRELRGIGVSFAHPTRTIHVAGPVGPAMTAAEAS